jgi:DNA polymerase-4/protein ImuB
LIAIPEQALVAQFGADGRSALEWASGRRIDRVRPEERERSVSVSLEFPAPVGQLDLLHGALDRLLRRALKRPACRGRSVRGIRLRARLEDGGSWSIRAIVKEPTGRADRLGVFLRSRIVLSPPQRAVEELRLEFFQFGPPSTQIDLFGPKRNAPRTTGSLETADGDLLPAVEEASRLLRLRLEECALYRVLEMQPNSRIPERRHALLGIG